LLFHTVEPWRGSFRQWLTGSVHVTSRSPRFLSLGRGAGFPRGSCVLNPDTVPALWVREEDREPQALRLGRVVCQPVKSSSLRSPVISLLAVGATVKVFLRFRMMGPFRSPVGASQVGPLSFCLARGRIDHVLNHFEKPERWGQKRKKTASRFGIATPRIVGDSDGRPPETYAQVGPRLGGHTCGTLWVGSRAIARKASRLGPPLSVHLPVRRCNCPWAPRWSGFALDHFASMSMLRGLFPEKGERVENRFVAAREARAL